MGIIHSKKRQQVPKSDYIVDNNNAHTESDNDLIKRPDRQNIEIIKKDLSDNPELFVLNNMIMGVMFFENYTKLTEDLKKDLLKKDDDFIAPDVILEKVSENVVYRPHHGPKKQYSEPLVPKRLFVLNEWIKVVGSTEEVEEDNEKTTVRIEESQKKVAEVKYVPVTKQRYHVLVLVNVWLKIHTRTNLIPKHSAPETEEIMDEHSDSYVRLRAINNPFSHTSGSPISRLDSIEPNSRSSEDSTDTNYYSELQNLKTPKPIEIIKGLEKHEQELSFLPKTCLSYRKIRKVTWDSDELIGEQIADDDLFETVTYINSKSFMKHLENDLFLNGVASKLGFDIDDIYPPESKQEKISCIIKEGDKNIPCEIIPTIQAGWPLEQTLKFSMKGNRTPELRKRCIFPTSSMIENITSLDCVLLPKGYLKKKLNSKDADIEWQLNFPQAQRYLETFMSHAQMKSLLILLTLNKTYIEPKTTHYGLLSEHIRNFILGECENNFSWHENRLGTKLIQIIKNLNNHLSKARPNIPDFFINEKNTLNDIEIPKIRYAQKVYDEIVQSPVMYFIQALRNLRYTNGKTFFPAFDFKTLYDILKKPGFTNQQIIKPPKQASLDIHSEHFFERFADGKKREEIMRRRQEIEKNKNTKNVSETDKRRGSVDSIDVDWNCEKRFDIHKKRSILKFFIETFINISEKSLVISSKYNCDIYMKQAFYLNRILLEECPAFTDEAIEYQDRINELKEESEKITVKGIKSVEFVKQKQVNMINQKARNGQNVNVPRKSVTFIEVQRRD